MPNKDQNTIPGSDFFKSLGTLEALAKGGQSTEEGVDKSQLFHTSSNSEKDSWEGGSTEKYGDNWKDNIGEDGTDYKAVRKAISEKVMKGEALTPQELSLLKADLEASLPQQHSMSYMNKSSDNDVDDEKPSPDEKDKACVSKSFNESLDSNDTIHKAFEVSDFLQEFAKSFGSSLDLVENRTAAMVEHAANSILQQLGNYMDERFNEQGNFNKSLAEAVVNIGHGLAGAMGYQNELANMPAGPPKSQMVKSVTPIEKGFAGPQGGELTKSQKLDIMCEMVKSQKLNPLEVTKYETTGLLRPDLEAQILKLAQAGNN